MIILELLFNTIKIKLLECSNMYKYNSKHQEAYNIICNIIFVDYKLSAKKVAIIL